MKSYIYKTNSVMKTSRLALIVCVLLFSLCAGFSGCAKKGCTNPKSDNYSPDATKDDGTCIAWRDKFIATYLISSDNCSTSPGSTYTLSLTASSTDPDKVLFSDGYLQWDGEVTSENGITIPNQTGNADGNAFTISGNCSVSDVNLTMNYTISANGQAATCVAQGVKQ